MKHMMRNIACMVAVILLSGNMMPYVKAATPVEETPQSMTQIASAAIQKGPIIAVFIFDYVDGVSATFVECRLNTGSYRITKNVFSGDSRIVEVVVTYNNTETTLGAWCDIYGQTGAY